MPIAKSIKENPGTTIAFGAIISTLIAIMTYLNTAYTSKDAFTALEETFSTHVEEIETVLDESSISIETVENKLRQEMKQARIETLQWDKKLLLAKGQTNLTDYDKTVIALIDAEIATLQGR